jgi:hypothetical protein
MQRIKSILSYNNYILSYLIVTLILVLSYLTVRNIFIDQTPWFTVQASDLTLNVILLYGLIGLLIDKQTKKMSKWKGWLILVIAFIVLTLFFVVIGGFNIRGLKLH